MAQPISTSTENNQTQNKIDESTDAAKNNAFIRDVVLVLIPTVIGAITSKFIVNSWQTTKEKNDIKREILTQYDGHVAKTYTMIGIFVESSIRQISNSPLKEIPGECKKFTEEYWQLSYAANRLFRSLRLYYNGGEHELENKYEKIMNEFGEIYGDCEKFINSKELAEALGYKHTIDEKLQKVMESMKDFESKLITQKLIIR